jgi:DNA-binding MarR family transcriptional regulator
VTKTETAGGTLAALPPWVPAAARHYLVHTVTGQSIRELARGAGCHASTVLRQVRRLESLRDDPLVDEALRRLGASHFADFSDRPTRGHPKMTAAFTPPATPTEETLEREARRVLRRLNEPGACLAIAQDMDKGVVVRDSADGRTVRTAVLDREIAEAMALKDWIRCQSQGRIARYRITQSGRSALKRLIAEEEGSRQGFEEASAPFADQHRDFEGPQRRSSPRYNIAESPLTTLARRRDKDGSPFLTSDLVAAGERLREDFELAQLGPRVTQNWQKFLTGDRPDFGSSEPGENGSSRARDRVAAALADLGPGLGDVALRCCCFLEGLEMTEKRMGWSARSGKIVLRIALMRLKRHYDEREDGWSPMIG